MKSAEVCPSFLSSLLYTINKLHFAQVIDGLLKATPQTS